VPDGGLLSALAGSIVALFAGRAALIKREQRIAEEKARALEEAKERAAAKRSSFAIVSIR
jgi:hypothetical protein